MDIALYLTTARPTPKHYQSVADYDPVLQSHCGLNPDPKSEETQSPHPSSVSSVSAERP
jgi:hypothetical protein